jgi:hypothetical protein
MKSLIRTIALAALVIGPASVFVPQIASASKKVAPAKHPSCATFFDEGQIETALESELGHSAVLEFAGVHPFQIGSFTGPTTQCGYNWANELTESPEPYSNKIPAIWAVAWGVGAKEWRQIVTEEESPEPEEGTGPWTHQSLKLGAGSKAFVVTSTAYNPPASYVYVLTRNHDLLWLDVWPAKLSALTGLAQYVLAHHKGF